MKAEDIFDAPAKPAPTEPAKEPPKEPAKTPAAPADADPFAEPPKTAPKDSSNNAPAPAPAPAEPAKPAAPAKPDQTPDDPFGKNADSSVKPAPAVKTVADPIATSTAKPVAADPTDKPANPSADDVADPFAPAPANAVKPAETKLKTESAQSPDPAKPADAPVEDPFAPLPAKPAAKDSGSIQAPSASQPAMRVVEVAVAPKVEKLVTTTAIENDPMRLWHDDSGEFAVRARLVLLLEGKVRLLKDTGKYTTVPLDRLSPADLSYVRQHASAVLAKLTAQSDSR